jgi:antitoxin ParD1/3/4
LPEGGPAMNVSLTPKLEKFVQRKLKSGMYASASEVIRDGLRLMEAKDKSDAEKLEALRKEIAKGVEQIERGEYIEVSRAGLRDFFEGIKRRGRRRLAQRRKKGDV